LDESILLGVPDCAAQLLLKDGGVFLCPLLTTRKFVDFCKKRGVEISTQRLLNFEKMGIFSPVFRLLAPTEERSQMSIPLTDPAWFARGWAFDTTSSQSNWAPNNETNESEAYYSQFQIASLHFALNRFTVSMQLEGFILDNQHDEAAWLGRGKQLFEITKEGINTGGATNKFRPSIDLLCQFISDRYFPHTQGNQRTIIVRDGGYSSDKWTITNGLNWKWREYARAWQPKLAEQKFDLNPERLRHAYESLARQQAWNDPLEKWYQLMAFVSPRQRAKLKGAALAADTMRSGAAMLGLLYKDLYGTELPGPNETTGTILTHMPELEVRTDARRHLELVVNQFDLNPRPKLTLFLEGQSEEVVVKAIFERYFGAPHGTHEIEIIMLGGVDNATGGKEDRYRAVLRLVDYLHYNQTFTFLILDNENYARRLKKAASKHKSVLHNKRFATRVEYIKVWKTSFEFDNFSASEIAGALNKISSKGSVFTTSDIQTCRKEQNPGSELSKLYKSRIGRGLNKPDLSLQLVETMFSETCRRKIQSRPLIKVLERVAKLAARNPFPVMDEVWEQNQVSSFLGKRRFRPARPKRQKQENRSAQKLPAARDP
jgi:hypothetical protein